VQAAQLAISDSPSVLQEQRWNNQGQAVQVIEVGQKMKLTYYLELKKTVGFPAFIIGEPFPLHVYLEGNARQPPW